MERQGTVSYTHLFYNRENVYSWLGADESLFAEDFSELERRSHALSAVHGYDPRYRYAATPSAVDRVLDLSLIHILCPQAEER